MKDTTAWLVRTGPLSYISQYHQLRLRKEFGQLSARQAWEMEKLRDLLEPRQVTPEGLIRRPLRLPMRREAQVMTALRTLPAWVEMIGLRHVELTVDRRLPAGLSLRLAIADQHRRTWFRFSGVIVQRAQEGSALVVELEAFLDSEPMDSEHNRKEEVHEKEEGTCGGGSQPWSHSGDGAPASA